MEIKIRKIEESKDRVEATVWFKAKISKFLKQMNSMDEEGKASEIKFLKSLRRWK